MGRMARIYYDNAVYHVMARGNNRRKIFKDHNFKRLFINKLNKYKKQLGFKLYGIVIMDNHVHMIIEANRRHNISCIMQKILLSFSFNYRKLENYIGHVWQGRFQCRLIEEESYIHDCLEYIHNNPVKAGIVKNADEYLWSSYRQYKEKGCNPELIEIDNYGDTSVVT